MVKNIKRNAFATGMQDNRDMRPLESPEPDAPTASEPPERQPEAAAPMADIQTAQDGTQAQSNAAEGSATVRQGEERQPPKEKRIGSNVTLENWMAWKMKSIEYGTKQAVLLNAAMDYCFQQGHFDQTLIDKYENQND